MNISDIDEKGYEEGKIEDYLIFASARVISHLLNGRRHMPEFAYAVAFLEQLIENLKKGNKSVCQKMILMSVGAKRK